MTIEKETRNSLLLVFGLIALGTFIKLLVLPTMYFWFDDSYMAYHSQFSLSYIFQELSRVPHVPLYMLLLHFWTKIFGISELALRSLSIVLIAAASVFVYLIAKELYDSRTGVYSSLLFNLSSFVAYFSLKVRPYSLFIFLACLSFYLFILYWKERKPAFLIGYTLVSAMMMYTHIFGSLVLLSQIAFILFQARSFYRDVDKVWKFLKPWIFAFFGIGLLFAPWIPKLFVQFFLVPAIGQFYYPPTLFGSDRWSVTGIFILFSGTILLAVLFVSLILFWVTKYLGKTNIPIPKKQDSLNILNIFSSQIASSQLMLFWLIVPPLILFLFSLLAFPLYDIRYIAPSCVAFYILAAAALARLKRHFRLILAGFLLIYMVLAMFQLSFERAPLYDDLWDEKSELTMKDTTEYIFQNRQPNETIYASIDNFILPLNFYAAKECFSLIENRQCLENYGIISDEEKLIELLSSNPSMTLWVITCKDGDCDEEAMPYLLENKALTYNRTGEDISLLHFS